MGKGLAIVAIVTTVTIVNIEITSIYHDITTINPNERLTGVKKPLKPNETRLSVSEFPRLAGGFPSVRMNH
jgi:hypothetical protein